MSVLNARSCSSVIGFGGLSGLYLPIYSTSLIARKSLKKTYATKVIATK